METSYSPLSAGAALGKIEAARYAVADRAAQAPVVPTLVRALSSIEELNKRLYQLHNQTVEIAQAVGGPYPIGNGNAKQDAPPQSAMQRLNDAVNDAHGTISNIEEAINSIRRSLGG